MYIDSACLSLYLRPLEPYTSDFEHVDLFDVFCVDLPFPKSIFKLFLPISKSVNLFCLCFDI